MGDFFQKVAKGGIFRFPFSKENEKIKIMKFGKMFGAALLAFFAGTAVIFTATIFFFVALAASVTLATHVSVSPRSVLTIDLGETITDEPTTATLSSIDLQQMCIRSSSSLLGVLRAIETAKTDPNIEGIYLCGAEEPGFDAAQGEELREALIDFRSSGKFVFAWSDYYSQLGYYVCSAADRVTVNPQGGFAWYGLSANMLFFKGLLDKLDIRAEVIRHGAFKSAVEPFVSDRMSRENALQMNALVRSIWGTMVGDIARSRELDSAALQKMADRLAIRSPQDARINHLVDSTMYRDQAMACLGELVWGETADSTTQSDPRTPELVSIGSYLAGTTLKHKGKRSRNEIVVLYADGEIVDGRGARGMVGSISFADKIRELREDERIKGVVLRVNSPGGSALAAENIWRELTLLQRDKPVVVSMGATAASGGYYIAAGADAIMTCRTTVTGSIGVFGLMFDVEKGLKNKLGITVDVARSNPSADLEMPLRPLSQSEMAYMQYQVDQVYGTFVDRVAAGRNLTAEQVDRIAQGRIWSGADATLNGLCDGTGGLRHALALTADRAGVADDFSIREIVPSANSFVEALSSMLDRSDVRSATRTPRQSVDAVLADWADAMTMLGRRGVQARMPYIIKVR
ncbi:signal peptide peptidase SppA [Bacteroidia bacterium]|nr:signal peptide peptidase SppA [Bacteroidia bacterium]